MENVVDYWWTKCKGCGNNIWREEIEEGIGERKVFYNDGEEIVVYLHKTNYCIGKFKKDSFKNS
jgi:pyruvate/2-oxoacid:ferredoxin oxidoreductase beta subunit